MTAHTLESLALDTPSSLDVLGGGWVATCSCHNPDGNGDGRADFRGDDAYLAYLAWAEHAAQQPDDIPTRREVTDDDGDAISVDRLPGDLLVRVVMTQAFTADGRRKRIAVYLTNDEWNTIRGAR